MAGVDTTWSFMDNQVILVSLYYYPDNIKGARQGSSDCSTLFGRFDFVNPHSPGYELDSQVPFDISSFCRSII